MRVHRPPGRRRAPTSTAWTPTDAVREYLWSLQYTIAAGTSQIQRNLIAERILGLPTGPLTTAVDRSASSRCPRPSSWPPSLRRVAGPGARRCETPTAERPHLIARPRTAAERALAGRDPRVGRHPRVGRRRRRRRTRATSTTPATSARSTRPSRDYEIAVDGDRATGTVDVPGRLRRAARRRARRLPRRVLRLRSIQHHNCDVGVAGKTTRLDVSVPPADAAAARPLTLRDRARRPGGPHRVRRPGCSDGDEVLCEATMRRDRRRPVGRCPAVSPPAGTSRDRRDRDRRRRRPAAHRRRPAAEPGRRARRPAACWSATTTSLTYARRRRSLGRAGRAPAGHGRGARHPRRRCCTPTAPTFVVGWLAAARIGAVTVPLSTFSTSRRAGRPAVAAPTSRSC